MSKFRRFGAVVVLLFCHDVLSAQSITGNVTGTVTDLQNAVTVGAKITVTSVDFNVSNIAVTNDVGVYSIRFLEIGQYSLKIEAPGGVTAEHIFCSRFEPAFSAKNGLIRGRISKCVWSQIA